MKVKGQLLWVANCVSSLALLLFLTADVQGQVPLVVGRETQLFQPLSYPQAFVVVPPGTVMLQFEFTQILGRTAYLDTLFDDSAYDSEILVAKGPDVPPVNVYWPNTFWAMEHPPTNTRWRFDSLGHSKFTIGGLKPGEKLFVNVVRNTGTQREYITSYRVSVTVPTSHSQPSPQPPVGSNFVPAKIDIQPATQEARPGQPLTFRVVASGTPPLHYRWYNDGQPLTIGDGQPSDVSAIRLLEPANWRYGRFFVEVSNTDPSGKVYKTTSDIAMLGTPPSVTTLPASQTAVQGDSVAFRVSAVGSGPLQYTWSTDDWTVDLTDKVSADGTLTLDNVRGTNTGYYRVRVSNLAGYIDAPPVLLNVFTPPLITVQPLAATITEGEGYGFYVVAKGSPPLTYQWLFKSSGATDFSPVPFAQTEKYVIPTAAPGGSFKVRVQNAYGTLDSQEAVLTLDPVPKLIQLPTDLELPIGKLATFRIKALGREPLSYQWSIQTTEGPRLLPGKTNSTLSIENISLFDAGTYTVVVSNPWGSRTNEATLSPWTPGKVGNPRWRVPLSGTGPPIFGPNGEIYVNSEKGFVALSSEGQIQWISTNGSFTAVGHRGDIYGWNQQSILALNASGRLLWQVPVPPSRDHSSWDPQETTIEQIAVRGDHQLVCSGILHAEVPYIFRDGFGEQLRRKHRYAYRRIIITEHGEIADDKTFGSDGNAAGSSPDFDNRDEEQKRSSLSLGENDSVYWTGDGGFGLSFFKHESTNAVGDWGRSLVISSSFISHPYYLPITENGDVFLEGWSARSGNTLTGLKLRMFSKFGEVLFTTDSSFLPQAPIVAPGNKAYFDLNNTYTRDGKTSSTYSLDLNTIVASGVAPYPSLFAADGTTYKSDGKYLTAYGRSGEVFWQYRTKKGVGTPWMGPDGTIYFQGGDEFFAITGSAPMAVSSWPLPHGGANPRGTRRATRPPAVAASPQPEPVAAGGDVSLSVFPSGTPPLAIQWRFQGTNIPGANAQTLTLTNIQRTSAGEYTAEVSAPETGMLVRTNFQVRLMPDPNEASETPVATAFLQSTVPVPNATNVTTQPIIELTLNPGSSLVSSNTVLLYLDSVQVDATVRPVAGIIHVQYLTPEPFSPGSVHEVALVFVENGALKTNSFGFQVALGTNQIGLNNAGFKSDLVPDPNTSTGLRGWSTKGSVGVTNINGKTSGFIAGEGSVSQLLSEMLQANTKYRLNVTVGTPILAVLPRKSGEPGNGLGDASGSFVIKISAGDEKLIVVTNTAPIPGSWTNIIVDYTSAEVVGPWQLLAISIESSAPQLLLDSVQFESSVLPVETPSIDDITVSTSGYLQVLFKGNRKFYYILDKGGAVAESHHPVNMRLGMDGAISLSDPTHINGPQPHYQLRQIPILHPLDTDRDGLDDVFELRNAGYDPLALNAIPPETDTDGDGLSDKWERQWDLNPYLKDTDENGIADGLEDPDLDQSNNLQEFLNSTDPLKPMAQPVSLLVNGSFENGTNPPDQYRSLFAGNAEIAGWTIYAGRIDWCGPACGAVRDGVQTAQLVGNGTEIGQEVATTSGHSHRLQFSLFVGNVSAPSTIQASLGDQKFNALIPEGSSGWLDYSAKFIASSTSSILSLKNIDAGHVGPFLDRVSLVDDESPQPVPCLSDSLIARWRFDGDLEDSAGINDGQLTGGLFVPGKFGMALSLTDPGSDYGWVPDRSDLNPTDQITLEAWVKTISYVGGGSDAILEKPYLSHTFPYYQYKLGMTGDQYGHFAATFEFVINTEAGIVAPHTRDRFWQPGTWYHVVGVYDGSSASLYVNGQLIDRVPQTGKIINFGQPIGIAKHPNTGGSTPGLFDEMAIYNRALTEPEILKLFSEGAAAKCFQVRVRPVPLQNATASASYLPDLSPTGRYAAAQAIDGVKSGDQGWSLPTGGTNATFVCESVESVGFPVGTLLTFEIHTGDIAPWSGYQLGRFRLSATSDDRSDFGNSLDNGGDVTANWTILNPFHATASHGGIAMLESDSSIFVTAATNAYEVTYTVQAFTSLTNINGFRLEAMSDDRLPNRGPGRSSIGNFILQELSVFAQPGEDPNTAPLLPPTIQNLTLSDGSITISWDSVVGRVYQIQSKHSMQNEWADDGLPAIAVATSMSASMPIVSAPTKFYRVVVR